MRAPTRSRLARPRPARRPVAVVRARLRRHRLAWWLVTGALALATAQLTAGALARAEAAADRWGGRRPVLVLTTTVEPGEVVDLGAVEVLELPAALVAPGAAGPEALGATAAARLHPGEVVHAARLAPAGLSLVAARLPPGARGIAVPAGAGALPLEPGDLVDVLATAAGADPLAGGPPPTVVVAEGALVVAVSDDAVTVAVPAPDAPRVADAVATGLVTLALAAP